MNDTTELPDSSVPVETIERKPKPLNRNIQLPGMNYFKERRMRPLFFGWLCGLATMLAAGFGVLLFWLLSYASSSSYNYGNFSAIYYASAILGVLVLVLLLLVTTIGFPMLYGHTGGVKGIIKIVLHELVFLAVILAVMLTISIRFSELLRPTDPYPYYPDDCLNCGHPL